MSKQPRGIFISFEGTEGSGKSTLIREVSKILNQQGYRVLVTREPGGDHLAEKIREILLHSSMDAKTELLLYEAARAEHLANTIRPGLLRGDVILCDRFTASTLAYQSHARGLPWKEVKALNQIATSGVRPDLTVLLDIDPEVGLKRAKDPNRFEAEGLDFHKRVRLGFLKARSEESKRWFTLKVKKETPEYLANLVVKEIFRRFKRRLEEIELN